MVNIGPATSEIRKAICGIFATTGKKTGQKLAYPTEYFSKYWIDLTKISALVSKYVRLL